MGHDATKVLMGTNQSSDRDVTNETGDPATFVAGLAVRRDDDESLSLTDGQLIGISAGRSLSDTKKTAVFRAGNRVPIQLTSTKAAGNVTITSYANLVSGTDDVVTINGTAFTAQAGAATPGDATFQAATSNDATATSLAAQINAHVTIGALVTASALAAVVTITAVASGEGGEAITLTYTDNDTNIGATVSGATLTGGGIDFAVVGAAVKVNVTTGKADSTGTTTGATYLEIGKTGIMEDGSTCDAAIIDMAGGL